MRKTTFFAALALCMLAPPIYAAEADVTTVMTADFTVFSDGSPEEPVAIPSYGTGAFTDYFTGWSASKVAQAGGALLINDGGSVRTPYQNLSANGGCFKVRLEARACDSYGGLITVKVGYSVSEDILLTNEWETVELILSGGTSYSAITISPFLSVSGVLVKSLTVEQSEAFIAAPVAYQPKDATSTGFTAYWQRVNGATDYLLDVYSYTDDGKTKEYLLKDESCGVVTSRKVEGLKPDKQYYYVVRASNGKGVSDDSNEIEVVLCISAIDAPELSASCTDHDFTLSWNAVENALSYDVALYKNVTLTEDAESDILVEDFSRVDLGSFSSVSFDVGDLDKWTEIPGWGGHVLSLALAEGMMVLDNYGTDRYIATPELDLSANNGKCKVKINMAQAYFGSYYDGGKVTIALEKFSTDDFTYNVIDTKDITIDTKQFKDYEVELTGGDVNCCIRITVADDVKERIYIDDIKISQLLSAGSVQRKMISLESCNETTYSGVYEPAANVSYSATVSAVGRTVSGNDIVSISSRPSNEVYFGEQLGVDNISIINDNAPVEYYDLTGRKVIRPTSGIYIRRQGHVTTKVLIP